MEIIHGLSNLEIETTDSSVLEKEEEGIQRNWLEIPADVTSLIFLKLGTIGILVSVQWVCTSWWKLSKQPHLFRCIHVEDVDEVLNLSGRHSIYGPSRKMAREAINRSCGQLVEFSVNNIANNKLLKYISEKSSSSLRCIRLVNCHEVIGRGFIEMAKKLPQLEELEIVQYSCFSKAVIETFGRFCPRLKSCRLTCIRDFLFRRNINQVALVIAENMPELRHLKLFANKLTDDDLLAILDGCPHLESLDLRECFNLEFARDLKKRCGNIKVLRLPNDPIDDSDAQLKTESYFIYDSDKGCHDHSALFLCEY